MRMSKQFRGSQRKVWGKNQSCPPLCSPVYIGSASGVSLTVLFQFKLKEPHIVQPVPTGYKTY